MEEAGRKARGRVTSYISNERLTSARGRDQPPTLTGESRRRSEIGRVEHGVSGEIDQ